jgi:glycosyltransferase involved in cell wall biosynthesis
MKKKIAIITTVPMNVHVFMLSLIEELIKEYEVVIITNNDEEYGLEQFLPFNVKVVNVNFRREFALMADIVSFIELIKILYKENFSLAYSLSPKSGLLGMMASWIIRIPNRVHIFTGQFWVNKSFFVKGLYILLDKAMVLFSTFILVDSFSQREFLIKKNILSKKKSTVLGSGSINGVNLNRFHPNYASRLSFRKSINVSNETVIFLFSGRVVKDKGVSDLIEAFNKINDNCKDVGLWIVGPNESNIFYKKLENKALGDCVKFFPMSHNIELFMQSADILCLPSHREGFANVIIEAAACGIPSIGSNIYGLSDSISDKKTGLLFKKKCINSLSEKMLFLKENSLERSRLGGNAKQRVEDNFNTKNVTSNYINFFNKILNK